jgi:16S rRNA (cytosine967-C5)-methyltransferase
MNEDSPQGVPAQSKPNAPPLYAVLCIAAGAWARLRAGESLDAALDAARAGLAPQLVPALARDPRLAGAVRDVASNAVRRARMCDYVIGALATRPPAPPVQSLLGVAIGQLLARTYADFTLVDQAVRAARALAETESASGFVNAILRNFLRDRAQWEERARADPARRFNVPDWWYRRVHEEYGAHTESILAAQCEEPPMVLRVNRRRASVQEVLADLSAAGMAARRVGVCAIHLEHACPVEQLPGFLAGRVSVQDAGAQLAAQWLGAADGMRVLDACAAPGGKTAHLRELADCTIDAVEIDPVRAQRISSNLTRLGLDDGSIRVHVADALRPKTFWDDVTFDRILLDAPCTASGVVRRHPDVTLLRRSGDVAKLATQQAKMLQTLWPLLAPAGRLLYVVCSVFAEEGRRQVAAFVRRQPGVRCIRLAAGDPAGVQLLPNSVAPASDEERGPPFPDREADPGAMPTLHDGFFYALLEKT